MARRTVFKGKKSEIVRNIRNAISDLNFLPIDEKIDAINKIKVALSHYSPFRNEPVDCVLWVKNEKVTANDYNPNAVAPPEMELLAHSILSDGYTQPIVTWHNEEKIEVIDGFHRNRVGRENAEVKTRVHGYLPLVKIKQDRNGRNDRIASTIRHNRARGKHQVDSMSDIVIELKKRNWSDARIGKELGMDQDEVLRLCQISGLVEVFADHNFTEAWEAEIFDEDDLSTLEEDDLE